MPKVPKEFENLEMDQVDMDNEEEDVSDEEAVIASPVPAKRKKVRTVTTTVTPAVVSIPGPSALKRKKSTHAPAENGFDIVLEDVENDNDSFQHRIKFGNGTQGNYFYFIFIFYRKEGRDCLQPKQKDCFYEILDA